MIRIFKCGERKKDNNNVLICCWVCCSLGSAFGWFAVYWFVFAFTHSTKLSTGCSIGFFWFSSVNKLQVGSVHKRSSYSSFSVTRSLDNRRWRRATDLNQRKRANRFNFHSMSAISWIDFPFYYLFCAPSRIEISMCAHSSSSFARRCRFFFIFSPFYHFEFIETVDRNGVCVCTNAHFVIIIIYNETTNANRLCNCFAMLGQA